MRQNTPKFSLPPELPVAAHATEIRQALLTNQVVVVCGDTGSGKTTQLPKIALLAGRGQRGMIGCTQPRRLATVAMARRVAEEFGQNVGDFIGYQHRFDRQLSNNTTIKFMTDGILLSETRHDRLFRAYDTLIIDEAHERSLNIDFLLGIIRRALQRRPDLRLIISSATLDVERFSEFFNHAPVISIPGRLYPIETRWQPMDSPDDPDLPRHIANAIDQLSSESRGDILVFLPGERDIRETAELLEGRRLPATEIIPLLASLPAAEQQRAFQTSSNRRIILSTNVAETSVTLPGIRYVIDSGLARISRFNPRTQVQRLQIEPISQASANQRRGRCGRVAPGICIRLYSEADYKKRLHFTPPEIMRSNLSGVILTMLDLKLGNIESFPFIDPPSNSTIREGYRELDRLDALRSIPPAATPATPALTATHATLTALGRKLATLPLDPALARMLLAAADENALADALIVVAALECEDPRRRPIDKQQEADAAHARFRSPYSDFAGFIKLWRWYHEENSALSQSALRRLCKTHFLSYPRMREWLDLRNQLARLCQTLGLNTNSNSGGDAGLHRALLTGLLTSIGHFDPEANDYRGANGLRFAIFPGSGLAKAAKKTPPRKTQHDKPAMRLPSRDWVIAGEIVETTRRYARTAACIEREWIEPLAKRHCRYHYHAHWWDSNRGFARVREQVTLFGLTLVEGRTRDLSHINPNEARAMLIREGLINGALPAPIPLPIAANLKRINALLATEEKLRQHNMLFDPELAYRFYEQRLPASITTLHALRRWLNHASPAEVATIIMGDSDLPPLRDLTADFPDLLAIGSLQLPLTYRHAPGSDDDGLTCHVTQTQLPALKAWHSDWLVPGLLEEKLRWMVSLLSARQRRLLQPLDDFLARSRSRLIPGRAPLRRALADVIYELTMARVDEDLWQESQLPPHLRVRIVVTNNKHEAVASSRDLSHLLQRFAPSVDTTQKTAPQTSQWQQDGMTSWECATLPPEVQVGTAGWPVTNYPALIDKGESVSLRLLPDPAQAAAAHESGVIRLFALALGKELKRLQTPPATTKPLRLYLAQLVITTQTLSEEIATATLRETFIANHPVIRSKAEFESRLQSQLPALYNIHNRLCSLTLAALTAGSQAESLLQRSPLPATTLDDISEQIAWLLFPGFAATVPANQLAHYPRYFEALRLRIERALLNPASDQRKHTELQPHWQRYLSHTALSQPPRHDPALLQNYRWMVEELRVSLFAQELRTPYPVSPKRLDKLWLQTFSR